MVYPIPNRRSILCFACFAVATTLGLTGCGDSDDFSTAPVTGKVVAGGQPVTEGTITLIPLATGTENTGKPAVGVISNDGTFSLSTYGENDGAVVGKHRVMYSAPLQAPPSDPAGGHAAATAQSKYAGAVPVNPEVEIKSGDENKLEIELKMPGT